MSPLIRTGDVLEVESVPHPDPGDIVVYRRDGRWVAHRLIRIIPDRNGEDTLVCRGDALSQTDPHLSAAQIVGRVHSITRGGKKRIMTGSAARLAAWFAKLRFLQRPVQPCIVAPVSQARSWLSK